MLELNELLVPVDFSPEAEAVFTSALAMLNGDQPSIIALHVVDPALAELLEAQGLGDRTAAMQSLRARAEERLAGLAAVAPQGVEVVTLVCEGMPFYEIVRKAEEFAVDAVVMARTGSRDPGEVLLFGSTTERVVRACRRPVLVIPG